MKIEPIIKDGRIVNRSECMNNDWPITNSMWRYVNKPIENYFNNLGHDCFFNVGFHDYVGIIGYYFRCEYIINGRGEYFIIDKVLNVRLDKDPWNRNFVCFPGIGKSKFSYDSADGHRSYCYEPVFKNNRTVTIGYLMSTTINGDTVWCLDMGRSNL